jgi:hypothetical protein
MEEDEKGIETQDVRERRVCRSPGADKPCPACRKRESEPGSSMLRRSPPTTDEEER